MNSATALTPRQTDEQLAVMYHDLYAAQDRAAANVQDCLRTAGAKFYYRGRQRVTDMRIVEAVEILRVAAAYVEDYKASHVTIDGDYRGTDWSEFAPPAPIAPHSASEPATRLARYEENETRIADIEGQIRSLEATYTGWSRFFLVVSSAGHIHSSMHCSTCRPTTRFGWLPELSDSTETEAVASHGPTLCSVCFPSAPLDWTTGKKLTAAQAARAAA